MQSLCLNVHIEDVRKVKIERMECNGVIGVIMEKETEPDD